MKCPFRPSLVAARCRRSTGASVNLLVLRGVVAVAAACLRLLERDDVSATRHGSMTLCVATGKNTAIAGERRRTNWRSMTACTPGSALPSCASFPLFQNTWMLLFYQRCDLPAGTLGLMGGTHGRVRGLLTTKPSQRINIARSAFMVGFDWGKRCFLSR